MVHRKRPQAFDIMYLRPQSCESCCCEGRASLWKAQATLSLEVAAPFAPSSCAVALLPPLRLPRARFQKGASAGKAHITCRKADVLDAQLEAAPCSLCATTAQPCWTVCFPLSSLEAEASALPLPCPAVSTPCKLSLQPALPASQEAPSQAPSRPVGTRHLLTRPPLSPHPA